MLLQPSVGQPPWAEEAGSFGPRPGAETEERLPWLQPQAEPGLWAPCLPQTGRSFPTDNSTEKPFLLARPWAISVHGQVMVRVGIWHTWALAMRD